MGRPKGARNMLKNITINKKGELVKSERNNLPFSVVSRKKVSLSPVQFYVVTTDEGVYYFDENGSEFKKVKGGELK